MSLTTISVYSNGSKTDVVKSLLFSYKQAFKAYYCNNNNLNKIAITSFRKTTKLKMNELANRNNFFTLADMKNNYRKEMFFDKTPDFISKNVKSHILTKVCNTVEFKKKQVPAVDAVLENEIIELITDLNYLAYLFNIDYIKQDPAVQIKQLIFDKNKRENLFSAAYDNDELKQRIKDQIELATDFKNKIPHTLKTSFNVLLTFIKMKYESLNDILLEDNYGDINHVFVIPANMKRRLQKLYKPYYQLKMSSLDRHKNAIKQLNRVILRLKTAPRVRTVNFKTAIYPMSLPIANTEKHDIFDSKMNLFFDGLRYQTFLTRNYNEKRLYLSDENAFNSFLQNLDDLHFDNNKNTLPNTDLNNLYSSAYMSEDVNEGLDNNLEYIKDNIAWLEKQNENIKGFFTKNLSESYLQQYMQDYSNSKEVLKKYNSLDLETVNPHDSKNDLDSRLIENSLIDDIKFFQKFGSIVFLFLKYIKIVSIDYHHDQKE